MLSNFIIGVIKVNKKFVCVKSTIDGKFRVMEEADAPYGICFSVGETVEDAIHDGASFLGIDPEEIEVW